MPNSDVQDSAIEDSKSKETTLETSDDDAQIDARSENNLASSNSSIFEEDDAAIEISNKIMSSSEEISTRFQDVNDSLDLYSIDEDSPSYDQISKNISNDDGISKSFNSLDEGATLSFEKMNPLLLMFRR